MAIRYGYFDSEVTGVDENGMPVFDRAETSDLFRLLFANLVSSGVLATPGDCFKVNADTGLTVRIRPGFAMINGAFAYDAEESTVTLATANANLPRIDRVVLRCNYLNRLCEIITKTGTPASTPAAPELLQPASGDYYELCLATIRVEAGATSVTQSAITDTRGDSSVCGFITQLIDHLDTSEFMSQLTAWQEEYSAEQQAAFTAWFNEMKDQLSEDAAGNLQNQITALETRVGNAEQSIGDIIDDEATANNKAWSSEKISGELTNRDTEISKVRANMGSVKMKAVIRTISLPAGTSQTVVSFEDVLPSGVHLVGVDITMGDFHLPYVRDGGTLTWVAKLWERAIRIDNRSSAWPNYTMYAVLFYVDTVI